MKKEIEMYIGTLKSENTKKAYRNTIVDFTNYCENNITFPNFIGWTSTLRDYASATRFQKIEAIRGFVGFLFDMEVISSDVYMRIIKQKTPKINNKQKFPLTQEQVNEMFLNSKNKRDKAILSLLFHNGLRVSELINIKMSDLNLDDGIVKIEGKGDKPRYAYLNSKTILNIEDYLQVRKESTDDNLFISNYGNKMNEQGINKTVKCIAKRSNIDVKSLNFSTHSCRHTCLTLLNESGVPIEVCQQVAGHSNIATTKRYVDVKQQRIKDTMMNFAI